jgi:hypothetical protein
MVTARRITTALLALGAMLAGLGVVVVVPASSGLLTAAEAGALFQTRSYYIASPGPESIRYLGCTNGDTQGRNTLFFGAPVAVGGTFGATLWGGADRTTEQIGDLVRDYVRGYVWCRRSSSFQLMVGMGTSTSAIDAKADDWLSGHGGRWAAVVADVNAWAERYYPGVARVYAAWDAEPSWSTPQKADSWMRGYDGFPGRRALHANFSADGCPRDGSSNGGCNNGWNQFWVWNLAWRYDPSLPFPQIYATSGVNGRQWQQIDLYGAIHHGDGMHFWGALSQQGACRQVGGCHRTDSSPQQAHDFLLWHLNTDHRTRQPVIETASDMHWHR